VTALERQAAKIREWLDVFAVPGQVVELRALGVGTRKAVCSIHGDLDALAARAAQLDSVEHARGCYFTPNPLRPDLAGATASCRKADVIARHWLLIDCDSVRPPDTSANEAERRAAWDVLCRCRGALDAGAMESAVVGDSGNGWHLCYPIDLPNDDAAQALVKSVLAGLDTRCSDSLTEGEVAAKVDSKVCDAPRIWKLYGTKARKGVATEERPHRYARLVEGPAWDAATARRNSERLPLLLEAWRRADDLRRGRPELSSESYARAALEQELAAIAGATTGSRNNQLNASAFNLGTLLAAGPAGLGECEVHERLVSAGLAAGLTPDEVVATVRSGLAAGAEHPRDLTRLGVNGHANGHAAASAVVSPATSSASPAAEEWDPPVPLSEVPDIEPFPLDVLPAPLRPLVTEGAEAMNCPADFLAVPMLVIASGCIGNSRRLVITRSHHQSALLFAVTIGRPGTTKTHPLKLLIAPLFDVQERLKVAWEREVAEWENFDGPDAERPQRPLLRRCFACEATTEGLKAVLQENPKGFALVRNELAGLIFGMNQYKAGGSGDDRQFYLDVYDGVPIAIDRKGERAAGPTLIRDPFISITGTTQPDRLFQFRTEAKPGVAANDGFLDRFLFAWPRETPDRGERWLEVSLAAQQAWTDCVAELLDLVMVIDGDRKRPGWVALSTRGKAAWRAFTDAHAAEVNATDFPDFLRGPWAKLKGVCARIALILELLQAACERRQATEVSGSAIENAARLVSYFKSHARKVFIVIDADPRVNAARKLLLLISEHGWATFSRRDAYRALRGVLRRVEDVDPVLSLLERHGYIRPAGGANGDGRKGRKPSPTFESHPSLMDTMDIVDRIG
jgi:hypothetical protein